MAAQGANDKPLTDAEKASYRDFLRAETDPRVYTALNRILDSGGPEPVYLGRLFEQLWR